EGLLAVRGDRGFVLVLPHGRQVARGLEGEGVPLADLVGVEQPAVFRGDDLEAVLLADLGQDALGQAELLALAGDHRVLEPGALGEEQDLLRGALRGGSYLAPGPGAEQGGPRGAEHLTTVHGHGAHLRLDLRSWFPAAPDPARA